MRLRGVLLLLLHRRGLIRLVRVALCLIVAWLLLVLDKLLARLVVLWLVGLDNWLLLLLGVDYSCSCGGLNSTSTTPLLYLTATAAKQTRADTAAAGEDEDEDEDSEENCDHNEGNRPPCEHSIALIIVLAEAIETAGRDAVATVIAVAAIGAVVELLKAGPALGERRSTKEHHKGKPKEQPLILHYYKN